jgi:1-hydroxy-2-methyl-2-(E)-butenyl 4-diphosphate synthase
MSFFNYKRRPTIDVKVGNIFMGGNYPVVIQTMTNTNTLDTEGSVAQCERIIASGADLIRLTTQGVREANNLKEIHQQLRDKGYNTPLSADIHFNPRAALVAATIAEKVRINPGNFVDKQKTFAEKEYTDEEYALELEKIRSQVVPFLNICKEHGTAVRIGVNHGSLSDRIMNRYGDTPEGMVESCMEFLRIAIEEDFKDIVISMKASNTVLMTKAVRLLVATMDKENIHFPLHLGVTEAGNGDDGRMKSAVGIGALLVDGIGDTIRVSLSEEPEAEVPVAQKLVEYINKLEGHEPIVPDERLNKIAELVKPQRILPTTVEIVDIAGLVKGASKGEGLGNKFLANIRETDAILHVLRCFDDENVTHVDGTVDPVRDKEIIDAELQLKDLETIESRISRVEKQAKTGGDKDAKLAFHVYSKIKEALLRGESARTVEFDTKDEAKAANDLYLLTSKPIMYVCNVDESSAVNGNKYVDQVREAVKNENAEILIVAAKIESEIAEFDNYEERQMFLNELGLEESGVSRLIKSAYRLLNLKTFITAGVQEVRAWTFHDGWKAPQCAGVIHTDFEKGFIRAEVIKYEDFITYGSENAVKEAGKMSVEGKDYIVQDGDIMHFRFNV